MTQAGRPGPGRGERRATRCVCGGGGGLVSEAARNGRVMAVGVMISRRVVEVRVLLVVVLLMAVVAVVVMLLLLPWWLWRGWWCLWCLTVVALALLLW